MNFEALGRLPMAFAPAWGGGMLECDGEDDREGADDDDIAERRKIYSTAPPDASLRPMKRDRKSGGLTRKEFLQAFAGLVAYSTPAAVALGQLGCSAGSGPIPGSDAGSNCSYSGTSLSCSDSAPDAGAD
ncbi:MAG: hypothetical protein JST00_01065 [Deltaproteobacteria bacterium]|nr:hypothetical protein [Deltaproteobacteria bacterium]